MLRTPASENTNLSQQSTNKSKPMTTKIWRLAPLSAALVATTISLSITRALSRKVSASTTSRTSKKVQCDSFCKKVNKRHVTERMRKIKTRRNPPKLRQSKQLAARPRTMRTRILMMKTMTSPSTRIMMRKTQVTKKMTRPSRTPQNWPTTAPRWRTSRSSSVATSSWNRWKTWGAASRTISLYRSQASLCHRYSRKTGPEISHRTSFQSPSLRKRWRRASQPTRIFCSFSRHPSQLCKKCQNSSRYKKSMFN